MRDLVIARILETADEFNFIIGYDLRLLSNKQLLDLYVQLLIEEYDE